MHKKKGSKKTGKHYTKKYGQRRGKSLHRKK